MTIINLETTYGLHSTIDDGITDLAGNPDIDVDRRCERRQEALFVEDHRSSKQLIAVSLEHLACVVGEVTFEISPHERESDTENIRIGFCVDQVENLSRSQSPTELR
jgi:hypothetical protein